MVCREGYTFKPVDVMSFYVFTKSVPLASLRSLNVMIASRSDMGIQTSTHFNVIHSMYACFYYRL